MTHVNSRRAIIWLLPCGACRNHRMASVLLAFSLFAAEQPPDAVIVAPREFLAALQPLVEHREQQGHRIAYLRNSGSPGEIRAGIRKLAASGRLKYVLIVGDAEPSGRANPVVAARCVPTHLQPAVVNVKWGSEAQIASDNWYADLDDDQVPELAIGRIPADSTAELSRVVAKI